MSVHIEKAREQYKKEMAEKRAKEAEAMLKNPNHRTVRKTRHSSHEVLALFIKPPPLTLTMAE